MRKKTLDTAANLEQAAWLVDPTDYFKPTTTAVAHRTAVVSVWPAESGRLNRFHVTENQRSVLAVFARQTNRRIETGCCRGLRLPRLGHLGRRCLGPHLGRPQLVGSGSLPLGCNRLPRTAPGGVFSRKRNGRLKKRSHYQRGGKVEQSK